MTLTNEQLIMRRRSVGSTDAAALLGLYHPDMAHLSKYKNATDVWLRIVHGIDLPGSSVMARGNKVEPLLLQLFNDTVMPCKGSPGTLRHFEHQWMVGSPDGDCAPVLVLPEFKTVGRWSWDKWGEPGTDKIPDNHNIQTQQMMAVTDLPEAYVLAAFGTDFKDDNGNEDFSVDHTALYVVKRDQALIDEIVACGERFMREHVTTGISPPMKPLKNIRKWAALTKGAANERVAFGC